MLCGLDPYSFHFILLILLKLHPSWPCLQHYPFYLLLWHDFSFYNNAFISLPLCFSRPLSIVSSLLFELLYIFIWVLVLKIPCFILNASSSQRRVCLKFLLLLHIIFLLYILLLMFLTSFKKCYLSITSNWFLSNYYSLFNGGYLILGVC